MGPWVWVRPLPWLWPQSHHTTPLPPPQHTTAQHLPYHTTLYHTTPLHTTPHHILHYITFHTKPPPTSHHTTYHTHRVVQIALNSLSWTFYFNYSENKPEKCLILFPHKRFFNFGGRIQINNSNARDLHCLKCVSSKFSVLRDITEI